MSATDVYHRWRLALFIIWVVLGIAVGVAVILLVVGLLLP